MVCARVTVNVHVGNIISYCKAKKHKMHGAMLKAHTFKDVLTHCYCASFLGRKFLLQCHTTTYMYGTCTSNLHTKEETY